MLMTMRVFSVYAARRKRLSSFSRSPMLLSYCTECHRMHLNFPAGRQIDAGADRIEHKGLSEPPILW
jgi:hypothetical protein